MERPLRELIDERIKWPAATALRRRRRARPRPGIGNGAFNAAMPTAFGVVFDRIDESARFLHLFDGVLEIGAAAGSVNALIKFRAAARAGFVDRLAQRVVIAGEFAVEPNLAVERDDHYLIVSLQLLDESEGGVLDVFHLEHGAMGCVEHK